jgi:hypothetical protein
MTAGAKHERASTMTQSQPPQPGTPAQPPPGQPGFYPDSQGAMRLWDGQRWTEVTRPMPPQPQQPKQPKKTPLIVKLVVITALLLWVGGCAAIIAAIGSSDPTTTAEPAASTATTAPAPSKAASKAPKTPEPEASQLPTVRIGEKVRDGDYQFTVTKVRCGVSRVGDQYANEKAQGQFCLVSMRVKNVGKEPINFSDDNQAMVDDKGREYSPDDAAWIYLDTDPYAEINPGNTLRTVVPFDVPKKVKADYLLLKAGFWGFSDGVRVKL